MDHKLNFFFYMQNPGDKVVKCPEMPPMPSCLSTVHFAIFVVIQTVFFFCYIMYKLVSLVWFFCFKPSYGFKHPFNFVCSHCRSQQEAAAKKFFWWRWFIELQFVWENVWFSFVFLFNQFQIVSYCIWKLLFWKKTLF